MKKKTVQLKPPKRWDKPFSQNITLRDVEQILKSYPFSEMDSQDFPLHCSLSKIILNDTRILNLEDLQVVCWQGEYGNSAYLVLEGCLEMVPLEEENKSHLKRPGKLFKKNFFTKLKQLWINADFPERRLFDSQILDQREKHSFFSKKKYEELGVTLLKLNKGEMVGESSALGRTQRSNTVIARGKVKILEIRWQGLRELMKRNQAFKKNIYTLYRQRNLTSVLQKLPLFKDFDQVMIEKIAQVTTFESYGSFEWFDSFERQTKNIPLERVHKENIIFEEENLLDDLFIIGAGFARISQREGVSHKTLGYLSKLGIFGLEELGHNWITKNNVLTKRSLRSIGYVDVLKIPRVFLEKEVFPALNENQFIPENIKSQEQHKAESDSEALLDFVVDNRYINGREVMVIDLERCVRCDECVTACAVTHDNNPRFIRHGKRHGRYMIANACMHCEDPVCMIGCPTGAISRSEANGEVFINAETCIGCSVCANNCPYDNIHMVDIRDSHGDLIYNQVSNKPLQQATKCDLCIDQGNGPACQRACAHDALKRIDLTDFNQLTEWIKNK